MRYVYTPVYAYLYIYTYTHTHTHTHTHTTAHMYIFHHFMLNNKLKTVGKHNKHKIVQFKKKCFWQTQAKFCQNIL